MNVNFVRSINPLAALAIPGDLNKLDWPRVPVVRPKESLVENTIKRIILVVVLSGSII